MSVYDLLTPLSVGKHYLDINVNSINIGEGGASFQGPINGPISISENSPSGNPIVNIVEKNSSPSNFNNALQSYNQSGTAGLKIVTVNDPSASSNIWADGKFSITTFQPTSTISLNPNDQLNALTCSFISPGQTQTSIQNISLPTSGGTATNLNYYEEYSSLFTFSGPWPSTYSRNVTITRIGRIVILKIDALIQTQNIDTIISMSGNLPTRFIPQASVDSGLSDFQVTMIDNANFINGNLRISATGGIQIFFIKYTGTAPYFYTNSSGLGSCGFNQIFISYSV